MADVACVVPITREVVHFSGRVDLMLSKVYFLTNANVNSRWILSFVFLFKINIDMNEMRYMAAIEIDRIQGGFDVAMPLSSIRYVRNR